MFFQNLSLFCGKMILFNSVMLWDDVGRIILSKKGQGKFFGSMEIFNAPWRMGSPYLANGRNGSSKGKQLGMHRMCARISTLGKSKEEKPEKILRDSESECGWSTYVASYSHNGESCNFFNRGIEELDLCQEDKLAATNKAEQGDRRCCRNSKSN